jgi:glycine cleavage system H protein
MEFPNELKYSKEHEWLRISEELSEDGNAIGYVGITDFAQSELGELVYVEVETIDEIIDQDDVFGTLEAVKTTSDLYMPIKGRVLAFNPALDESEGDDPSLINSDPYGEGWIIKLEIMDKAEIDSLMDSDAYQALIA